MISGRFEVVDTTLRDLKVIERKPIGDSRGYLERLFCRTDLAPLIGARVIDQINHTLTSRRGTVRGLHFQRAPYAELKVVSCIRGAVFDVAVDLRRNSPTFRRWHGETLSEQNRRSLIIPEGFAHGFQTLDESCELLYFHTAAFVREAEGGVHPEDPMLSIRWPERITELSDRDRAHPMLMDDFRGLEL